MPVQDCSVHCPRLVGPSPLALSPGPARSTLSPSRIGSGLRIRCQVLSAHCARPLDSSLLAPAPAPARGALSPSHIGSLQTRNLIVLLAPGLRCGTRMKSERSAQARAALIKISV